jgi:RHS repeat-associated core domain
VKKYYSFAGQTVAMKDADFATDGFKYFLSDHLGSTSLVLKADGTILQQQRYLPFGQPRTMPPFATVTSTDLTYTGQRSLPNTGLMDYKARFYSPALGRFIQPDSIIPGIAKPQSWNRFSYVGNNPTKYNDPTGHMQESDPYEESDGVCDPGDTSCNWIPKPNDDYDTHCNNDPDCLNADDDVVINPDEELKEETNEQYTPEFLEYCVSHNFDPSCTPVLPQASCSLPILNAPGQSTTPTGCHLTGYHVEYQLSEFNKWRLALDIASFIGSFVPFLAVFCTPLAFLQCVALGETVNVAITFTSMAYNLTNGDLGSLTWDVAGEMLPELIGGGRIFPAVGALISLADMAEISEESKIVVSDYQPNFTPLPAMP